MEAAQSAADGGGDGARGSVERRLARSAAGGRGDLCVVEPRGCGAFAHEGGRRGRRCRGPTRRQSLSSGGASVRRWIRGDGEENRRLGRTDNNV